MDWHLVHWLPVLLAALLILIVGGYTSRQLLTAKGERAAVEDSMVAWRQDLENSGRAPAGNQWAPMVRREKDRDVVTRAIRTVYLNRNREPDLEALASVLSQAEASQLAFARMAPNLIFLCGLAGTVVGILLAVGGLATVLGRGDGAPEFTERVASALGAIPPAFLATLLGIMCALAYAWAINGAIKAQSDLLARVQEFILTEVAPILIPERRDRGVEALRTAVEQLSEHLVVLPRVLDKATEDLTQSMTSASAQITEALAVAKEVSVRSSESAQQIAGASGALRESAAALEKTHDELAHLHEQMLQEFAKTQSKIDTGIEVAVSRLGDATRAHLEGMVAGSEAFRESTAEVGARLSRAAQTLASVSEGITSLDSAVRNQAEELWQRVGTKFDSTFNRAEEVFTLYREKVADLNGTLEQGLNGIRDQFSKLLSELDPRRWPEEEWRSVRTALTTAATATQAIVNNLQALESAQVSLQQLSASIAQLRQVIASSGGHQDSPNAQVVVSRLDNIHGALMRIEANLKGGHPTKPPLAPTPPVPTSGQPPQRKRKWWWWWPRRRG